MVLARKRDSDSEDDWREMCGVRLVGCKDLIEVSGLNEALD